MLINCGNKRLLGHVKAFDRHWNMENVKELWTEVPNRVKCKKKVQVSQQEQLHLQVVPKQGFGHCGPAEPSQLWQVEANSLL